MAKLVTPIGDGSLSCSKRRQDAQGGIGHEMNEIKSAEIYRVCAVSNDRWDVYQEPRHRPVASFNDKAAALNYAMCLARGRVAWHLLLRPGEERPDGAPASNGTAPVIASH
jgi:hypothetical protein